MQQKIENYQSLSNISFDYLLMELYNSPGARSRIILSMQDDRYSKLLDVIEDYILVAKEQLNIGNRQRAYRIYLMIHLLIDEYVMK